MTNSIPPTETADDERLLRDAEILSRSGSWEFFPDTGEERWSDGLRNLLAPDGTAPRFLEMFPDLVPKIHSFIQGRIPYIRHKWTVADRDGDPMLLLLQLAKRKSKQDGTPYLLGVVQDISEIEPPPATPGLGDQLLTNILSFGELFALIIDTDGKVMYVDGLGAARAGFDAAVIGGRIEDLFHDAPQLIEKIKAAMRGEPGAAVHQRGGLFIEYRFNPLFDQTMEPCGVIGFAIDVTTKTVAARGIEESERKYRTVFDNSRDAIVVLDRNGRVTLCNPKAMQMVDLKPGEMIGRSIVELSPLRQPDGRLSQESFEEAIRDAKNGVARQFEWAYRRLDGTLTHADVSLSPVELDGELFFIHLGYDRTEQINAKRSEIMLVDVFRSIQDGILLVDRDFNIVRTNEAMQQLYPKCEFLTGEKCHEVPAEDGCLRGNCPVLGMPRGLKSETRIRFEPANGTHDDRWIEHTTLPIIDQRNNKVINYFNSVRDVTERIKNEKELDRYRKDLEKMVQQRAEQLELSEATLRGVLEGSNSAVHFIDNDLKTTYANPAYQALLGYSGEELLTFSLDKLLYAGFPETRETLARMRRLLAGSLDRFRIECPLRKKNNEPVWVDVNVSSVRDMHGKIQQAVAVMADVTDRRKMLRELNEAITSAEGAKQAADAANTSKSQFLAHMSHEIRTPLNGVIGLCDLLLQTELGPKQLEYAQLIRASGKSLFYLINDILDFSKIEAGKLDIDYTFFDLYHLVESVLGILATRAEDKGIELCLSIDPQIPREVLADSGRIRQILINLIGNAIKFTDHGGVHIHLFFATEPVEVPAGDGSLPPLPNDPTVPPLPFRSVLRFHVIDSGIGIPKDRMDRLFHSFSQIDSSTARKYGGTGLGLAISIRLANLMGGEMNVESEEGGGTTFWFTVPVRQRTAAASTESFALLADLRAMVVDGNAVQRKAISEQLSFWKMRSTDYADRTEAFRSLQGAATSDDPYRLVVIDRGTLGNGEGDALLQSIRGNAALSSISTILLVPLTSQEEASGESNFEHCLRLTKPVFNGLLLDAVNRLLFDDGGSTSSIILPRPEESGLLTRNAADRRRQGVRILVAEDNRVNQIVVKDTLQSAGYDCVMVENGRLACDAVMSERFDLILMDCQMPEMDGYEATRTIRQWECSRPSQLPRRNRIPIIALTANVTKEDEAICLDAGMDAYCSKPINPKTLIDALDQWLPERLNEYTHHSKETVPEHADEPIVIARIEEHCGGNKSIVHGILNEFDHQVPLDFLEIEQCFKAENYGRIWTVIHSMKGTAGVVGAATLHDLCNDIERASQANDGAALKEQLPKLHGEIGRCIEFIRRTLDHHG